MKILICNFSLEFLPAKTGAKGDKGDKGDQGVGVTYKGAIDATTAPEPVDPQSGDFYVNTTTGETTWTGKLKSLMALA